MNIKMFFTEMISAKKIKRTVAAAIAFCCAAAMTLTVSAVSGNEITLEADGGGAVLELYFPQAAAEGIASMQISVSVSANAGKVNAEFIPDSSLAAKIVESRYQSGTGMLNIYLAGTETLFPTDGRLTVGSVRITSENGSGTALLEVVKDSVRFVRGGELVSPEGETDYPSSVNVAVSGQSAPNIPDETGPDYPYYPSYPNYPPVNGFPSAVPSLTEPVALPSGADGILNDEEVLPDGGNGNPGSADSVGERLDPPDTSALLEALSRADDYRKSDYTESSYADLAEAIDNANKLLSDPNAVQDEIDEALLDIENAIGMLTVKNDIPSGADGYGENKTEGAGNNGGLADGGESGESGEASVSETVGQAPDGSGENEYGRDDDQVSDNTDGSDGDLSAAGGQPTENVSSPAVWIIIAIIAVIAAAAVIVVRKLKNKASDGKHFKV